MCGPSAEEIAQQQDMSSFSSMLRSNYTDLFSKQEGVLGELHASISPIINAGSEAHGMSPEELNARQATAVATSGAAAQSAEQAARLYSAGRGGGATSGVMSGIDEQIQAGIASQSAQAEASRLNQITSEDYAIGRENFWRATGVENAIAGGYSPNAAQSGAISGGEAAFGMAQTIEQQREQAQKEKWSLIASAVPFAGKGIAGGLANLDQQGTSTGGEQLMNFFTGAVGAAG